MELKPEFSEEHVQDIDKMCTKLRNILYEARINLAIYELIGTHADEINNAGQGKSFWGQIQSAVVKQAALNICKLHEPQKSYTLFSLWGIFEKAKSVNFSFAQSEIERYQEKMRPFADKLERLKDVRDKVIAHPEHVDPPVRTGPSVEVMHGLIEIVQVSFVSITSFFLPHIAFDDGQGEVRRVIASTEHVLMAWLKKGHSS